MLFIAKSNIIWWHVPRLTLIAKWPTLVYLLISEVRSKITTDPPVLDVIILNVGPGIRWQLPNSSVLRSRRLRFRTCCSPRRRNCPPWCSDKNHTLLLQMLSTSIYYHVVSTSIPFYSLQVTIIDHIPVRIVRCGFFISPFLFKSKARRLRWCSSRRWSACVWRSRGRPRSHRSDWPIFGAPTAGIFLGGSFFSFFGQVCYFWGKTYIMLSLIDFAWWKWVWWIFVGQQPGWCYLQGKLWWKEIIIYSNTSTGYMAV